MGKIRHFIEQSWLLIVASFCFGLLIAATNATLSERIEYNEKKKLDDLMRAITDANDFEVVIEAAQVPDAKGKIARTDIYKAVAEDGGTVGFAYIAVGAGFADKIKLVIAVDDKCKNFLGFKVLASNETPGIGSRIKEDYFGEQFKQAPAGTLEAVKAGDAAKIDSEIVAISGATVSSEAVVKIFNTYVEKIKGQLQAKGLISNGK